MSSNTPLSDLDKISSFITNNLQNILETLSQNVIEIDETLLYEHFNEENQEDFIVKAEQTAEKNQPISLEEFEEIYQQLDAIDAKLSEPKAAIDSSKKKETKHIKRYNSHNDIDKTMFMMPPPPPPSAVESMQLHNGNSTTMQIEPIATSNESLYNFQSKVSKEMIKSFNEIKGIIADQLKKLNSSGGDEDNDEYAAYFRTFSNSVEQIKIFFEQIKKCGADKPIEKTKLNKLDCLDEEFCDLLNNLAEVNFLIRIRLRLTIE